MLAKLASHELRIQLDPAKIAELPGAESEAPETIIGQERALNALKLGLGLRNPDFNVYVSGIPGTGRRTAVMGFLDKEAKNKPVPDDLCYVNNFKDPYKPKCLRLPPGRGDELKADMKNLIEGAKREIAKVFESEEYAAHKDKTMRKIKVEKTKLLSGISDKASAENFSLQMTPLGFVLSPMRGGKPITDDEFMALSSEEKKHFKSKQKKLGDEIKSVIRQIGGLDRIADQAIAELDRESVSFALDPLFNELREKYATLPQATAHIEEVKSDILENADQFRQDEAKSESVGSLSLSSGKRVSVFRKYEVNVLVNNAALQGAPVVLELNPTLNNLCGRIEKEAELGTFFTDFTMIREGALHRANGGYLVVPAEDLLRNPFSWDALKRSVKNREITVEDIGESLGFLATKSLKPVPVPMDVKILLIGVPSLYYLLHLYDEDFRELFKIKADFDVVMDRTDENTNDYIASLRTVCSRDGLNAMDPSALAQLLEYSSRLAEDQTKLSALFGKIADTIREACHYSRLDGSAHISAGHIRKAIEADYYRSNLIQDKVTEAVARDDILIDIAGEKVGQINGLSVISLGDIYFGRPNKITASIGLGRAGVVNIEREAKLSGPIHNKAVMILTGYLTGRYALDRPLTLSAHLVFEQSYSEIEGDSASAAELIALLSVLSGAPVRQGIAVTGSVNQKGELQAVGSVNEKIEGYFEICRAKGLTGEQGVLIPVENVKNLMLKEEVVQAVESGSFHIWRASTIADACELATGVKFGRREPGGQYEQDSISQRIETKLRNMAESLEKSRAPEERAISDAA